MTASYTPKKEDLFIFRCSAANPQGTTPLEIIKDKLDWEYIYRTSLKNQTAAMLYLNLKSKNMLSYVPDKISQRFKRVYIFNYIRNSSLLDEFEKIIKVINETKVQAVPIKGFSLLLDVYPDIGTRGIADLDLLTDNKDVLKIFSALDLFGYKQLEKKERIHEALSSHHKECISKDKKISLVEVHFRFFPWYIEDFFADIKPADIISRSKKTIWRNIEIYKMNEVDEFIFSLLNYYATDFAWARYLFDADAIIKRDANFKWQQLLTRIKEYGIATQISYGIIMCKEYLNSPIPDNIMDAITRLSKRAYSVENILAITLKIRDMPRREVRIMRFKEAANFDIKASMIKEGLIWHAYKRLGIFSSYIKKKSYN